MAAKRRKKRRAKRRAKRKAPRYARTARRVPARSAALRGSTPYEELSLQRALAKSYEEQLDDIGRVLSAHGVISRAAIAQHGVRFAVIKKFEPDRAAYEDKRPR